jgi:phosphatidate phosphatase APP1
VVRAYRGYGSAQRAMLVGRVYRQPYSDRPARPSARSLRGRIVDLARWLLRWGLAEAPLRARFYAQEQTVTTDHDGYFQVRIELAQPPPDRLWHEMTLELITPVPMRAHGEIFIPPSACCSYGVISDIDDTVMATGVANKLKMMWRLFMQRAESRVAFPGVAAFLRALHQGPQGTSTNPMLYVSRAPWSIYEILEAFFRLHRIPVGPILFLREWGLTLQHPLPRRSQDHKLDLIRDMLALYDRLPFVLIGDSSQRDPEVYAQVVREHPGRITAIYIRTVGRIGRQRVREIEALAHEAATSGSQLVLADDSSAMARHAATHGLITSEAASAVAMDEGGRRRAGASMPQEASKAPSPGTTLGAVRPEDLRPVLEQVPGAEARNIVVEPTVTDPAAGRCHHHREA